MSFETAAAQAITDVARHDIPAESSVARGLGLVLAAWPGLAEHEPERGWDLFALHVLAAVEALHLGLDDTADVPEPPSPNPATGRTVRRLVEALADRLETDRAGGELAGQLEWQAAATQLRYSLDALV